LKEIPCPLSSELLLLQLPLFYRCFCNILPIEHCNQLGRHSARHLFVVVVAVAEFAIVVVADLGQE